MSYPPPPPLLEVKRYCAQRLPRYMLVDQVRYVKTLPRTVNGKVDRQALLAELDAKGVSLRQAAKALDVPLSGQNIETHHVLKAYRRAI